MSNEDCKLTVEQKFAKLLIQLRILRPFYSAIYEVMEKEKTDVIGTIGVTTNKLKYNEKFMDETEFTQLIFIMLHEIAHIGLKHVARRENRDPQLWNTACDYYVNKVISEEFGILPGDETQVNGVTVAMPTFGLFCSSIDTDEDYVEKIYEGLEKQAKKNGYFSAKNGITMPGNSGKNGSSNRDFEFTVKGSKNLRDDFTSSSKKAGQYKEVKINISPDSVNGDLINTGDDADSLKQSADKIVSDALVRVEMNGTGIGDQPGGLLSIIKEMLKSELDWRKLLRKYLIAATVSDSSFSHPDKRMYYQRSIYPGQVKDEENQVKGVKVCIDTSGSISDEDIMYFCGQVYDLTKQFKIDAELIYWDTSVESTGNFTGYKEFQRVDIVGRGGTEPSVIFNYFDSKKCKVKPIVTLVFTDGYFYTDKISNKQKKKYKDTIWIMTRNYDKNFTPPFGRKAVAKFS